LELVLSAVHYEGARAAYKLQPFRPRPSLLVEQFSPSVILSDVLSPRPIVLSIGAGPAQRYMTVGSRAPQLLAQLKGGGYLNEAMLYDVENAGGYNPVQLLRYWVYLRAAEPPPYPPYNLALFTDPSGSVMDLLQVGIVIAPPSQPAQPGWTPVGHDGQFVVYRRTDAPPRASVVPTWVVMGGSSGAYPNPALEAVLANGFDSSAQAVLEQDPGLGASSPSTAIGDATYRELGDQAARVDVATSGPALVLIRTAYDKGWHATVDGHPAPLLRADYLLQAVPVGSGRHVVLLEYDDPWIGYGLVGSALSIAVLLGIAFLTDRRTALSAWLRRFRSSVR
jgi:hypothetical protein